MRKIDVSQLPKKKGNFNKINWKNSIGCKIPFVYDDIEGELDVIGYDIKEQQIWLKYNDEKFDKGISTDNLQKCKLGYFLGKITNRFKYNIGYKWNDCEVIDKEYRKQKQKPDKQGRVYVKNEKWYKYKCLRCGYEGWIIEGSLIKGIGCTCCSNQKAVLGINTIWDTDRWMCDLGVSEEDAKKYTPGSNKKIEVTCPDCATKKNISIKTIKSRKSIGCNCSDGFSYISKYILNVIKQLNINYNTEVKYDWNKYINPKNNKLTQASIDFVIYKDGREIPLEADGGFHRKDNNMTGITAEMQQDIDQQRDKNCLKHLREETIRISDEGDIKENILNSKLNELFDLSNIDWSKCEEFALKNIVREVCEYWNQKKDCESVTNLINAFNSDRVSIIKYLKKGTSIGWCNYDEEKEYIKGVRKLNKNGKPIEIFKNDISLGVLESCAELERQSEELFGVKLLSKNISAVCLGKRKTHKGFTFKYK